MAGVGGLENFDVIYDWQAENDDDLTLRAGETVMVQDKHEHGWWFGYIERNGELTKGHFPKNYVKPSLNSPPPPPPPVRPLSVKQDQTDVATLTKRLSRMLNDECLIDSQKFTLGSLQAFDDLIQFGVAVEIVKAVDDSLPVIEFGKRVELDIIGLIWDGAETVTREFGRGKISFTTGLEQVTMGLDAATQKLKVGEKAVVTCSHTTAYGAAGNPPHIYPFTHIIYKLEVLSESESGTTADATGPDCMLGSGLGARAKSQPNNKKSVVLDP